MTTLEDDKPISTLDGELTGSLDDVVESARWVRSFQSYNGETRELLGGKGAGLAEMTSLGLPIPQGFTLTTEACLAYFKAGNQVPGDLWDQVQDSMKEIEKATGQFFGDSSSPLLVSVRSGAAVSMPGMMDTVLNLGINQQVAEGIAQRTGNMRFALDLYRRFIQMYGQVVLGVDGSQFDQVMQDYESKSKLKGNAQLGPDDLTSIITNFKGIISKTTGTDVPEDPFTQLKNATVAVFDSWNTRRAIDYRNHYGISHDMGTAVNIVAMVYGNIDETSGSGVCFSRNPATGEKKLFGEYLANAQGEDVVSGTATPSDISQLAIEMPGVYKELVDSAQILERHYGDVQDIEFTVERGKFYLLQTRAAQRSPRAAVKTAVDMADEGLISRDQAILRVNPNQIYNLLVPRLDEIAEEQARSEGRLLSTGMGASPGGATGKLVFDADTAQRLGQQGINVILVRPETSPEDMHGMLASVGILTSRGGTTSHAAVVARGLGKPCITGAESINVNTEAGTIQCGDMTASEGDEISIDGTSGEVFVGAIATIQPRISEETDMVKLLEWADDVRVLGVWANTDYPRDVEVALEFGAEGIGLCRTEHMFFEAERLDLVRKMILAAHDCSETPDGDCNQDFHMALEELEKYQMADFEGIFRAMEGRPAVIRLLDPPLHEFLPNYEELLEEVITLRLRENDPEMLLEKEELLERLKDMREVNPMLGLRGCRLGLKYPAIYEMQVRAIVAAACNVVREGGATHPEIMVPLVGHGNEMRLLRENLESTIQSYLKEAGCTLDYKIGTMIEVPRAALTADEIAETAEFFSFGTNDMTQTAYGYSRDDAEGKFLMNYLEKGVIPEDPFQVLDRDGVGELMKIGVKLGKQTRPDLTIGICGEHGGDPSSIEFCHIVGLDYVSCSPYRVPVARLAAAQAALNLPKE